MFCSPWDCQWKAPDRPFVFRSADGRLPRKSPMQPMRLSESRSELKTRANMPSLRQIEFAFEQFAIRVVERDDAVTGQAFHLPARQTATEAVAIPLRGRDTTLETEARQLMSSLGGQRIASQLRVEWNSRLQTAAC